MKHKKEEKLSEFERKKPDIHIGLTYIGVKNREELGLSNKNKIKTGKSVGKILKDNFITFFNILLFGVAVAYILTMIFVPEATQSENHKTITYMHFGFLIFALVNIIIGTTQELRAMRTIEKLNLLIQPTSTVRRDGVTKEIPSTDIVLDDLVIISAGKQIPVDGIVLSGFVEVDESMLTGESNTIEKHENDEVYAGSIVTSGEAIIYTDKVGSNTYTAKIQNKVKSIGDKKSELQLGISKLLKVLSFSLIPATLITMFGLVTNPNANFVEVILGCGASVTGSIPTGLVLLTTVSMAVSVLKMSKKKTLLKNLYDVESLAKVTTVCLDKTGTLTTERLNLIDTYFYNEELIEDFNNLFGSYLDAVPGRNATAKCLSRTYGLIDKKMKLPVSDFKPFSSANKYSEVSFKDDGIYRLGAPEAVFSSIPKDIQKDIDHNAKKGYRVLGFSKKAKMGNGFVPVALFILQDEIRESTKETIKNFIDNNVNIRVISGDSPTTVSKIAEQCGIPDSDLVVNMREVTDENIEEVVLKYRIFARVNPEQKAQIVSILQKHGEKVCHIGDGINDILALKTADCSVTFNKADDAAKRVASIVLLDNDFSHLPDVIMEGRRVVNNCKRTAGLFLMKSFFTIMLGIISVFIGGFPIQTYTYTCLQTFIIAVPGIFLSLEPSKEPLKPGFCGEILKHSIPAGFFILITIIPLTLLQKFGVISPVSTEISITLTINTAGLIILFDLCKPFTKYHKFVYALTVILVSFFLIEMDPIFIHGTGLNNFIGAFKDGGNIITAFVSLFTNWNECAFFTMEPVSYIYIIGVLVIGIPIYKLCKVGVLKFLHLIKNQINEISK